MTAEAYKKGPGHDKEVGSIVESSLDLIVELIALSSVSCDGEVAGYTSPI